MSTPAQTDGPRLPPLAMLVAVTAAAPVAMHLFVPSMPGLVEVFEATPAQVQLTLTLYMLALAFATLALGPLADRLGRRPVILAGLVVYAGASVLCALATSLEWLIAGRVAQAVGGAAGLVLGRTMVRDCFGPDRAASVIATLTMIMAVIPALSPAIGGYLDVWLGWRAGFALLAACAVVVWLLALGRLTETRREPAPGADGAGQAVAKVRLLRDRTFLGYGLHCVCTLAAWYAIVAGAPYIMVTIMGRTPGEYGAWFVLVACGWIGGNLITSRIATRVGIARLVLSGALVASAASTVVLLFVAADALTPPRLFLPLALLGLGHGLSQPSALSGAIGTHPHAAGRASGMLGFAQMTCGAAAAQALGMVQGATAWPLAIAVMAISLASLACWALARSR